MPRWCGLGGQNCCQLGPALRGAGSTPACTHFALTTGQDAHARYLRVLGADQPDTLRAAIEPAVSPAALGRDVEATRARDTLARCRRVFGAEYPRTLAAAHCLAAIRHGAGDRAEGRRMHQEILTRRTAVLTRHAGVFTARESA